ncbi:hypothetical protein [uncultured Sphingobacterium sp.]|uniref:hypothetical protein n=1 Tax=uncultured Sphingobacterium sp. TaxID=182688 RepID=UPI0037497089
MDEYNSNRSHEGLGNLTPTELSKNIRHKQRINQLVTEIRKVQSRLPENLYSKKKIKTS